MYQNPVAPEDNAKYPKTGDEANRKNLQSKKVLSCSRALSVVPKLIWPSIRAFICGRYQSTTEYQTPHSGIVPVRTISNSVTTVTQYSLFQPSICELSPTQRLSPNSSRCFLNHNQTTLENECERYPPRWMIITHSLLT